MNVVQSERWRASLGKAVEQQRRFRQDKVQGWHEGATAAEAESGQCKAYAPGRLRQQREPWVQKVGC